MNFDLSETVFGQPIWGDEGFSAILSMRSLPEIIKIIANDTSPPLWNICEWIVFNTLGTDEVYIRALSFLFFALAVLFTYKIGSLLYNRKAGLISAALTFFNPFFFTYAFEGRMYSIMAFGVAMSMYFFLKLYKLPKSSGFLDKAGYVIGTLWALYSHHFAIFALFIQGFWWLKEYLFGKRVTSKKMFKLFIAVGIGYLPWAIPLYNQTKKVGGGFWLGTPDTEDLKNLIIEYVAEGVKYEQFKVPFTDIALHSAGWYLSLIILAFRKWHKSISKTLFLLMWFLGPILMTWVISQYFQSIFFNRYLLYTIPAAMLVLGSRSRKYSLLPIALLLVVFIRIDYHYFTHPTKLPFRQMSEYVKQTKGEDDILINWDAGSHHLWETKYYGIPAPIYVPDGDELPFFVGTALMTEQDLLREIPQDVDRVGVITSGSIEEVGLEGYTEDERKVIDGLKFMWLRSTQNQKNRRN